MQSVVTETTKQWPSVYFRVNIPEHYQKYFEKKCKQIIVEPWTIGEAEPISNADLTDCEIIFTLGFIDDLSILAKAPNVKWVQSLSVGVDALINDDTQNNDLLITNTKGCTSVPIAEHAMAMILAFSKRLPELRINQQRQLWKKAPVTDLLNARVCIVGYGQIGYEIAKRCKAFGMKVSGCRRHPTDQSDPFTDLIVGMDRVDEVIQEADYIVLALPATPETDDFLNSERINQLKEGAVIINVGRGNAIVESDLVDALYDGQISGAALDVFQVEPLPATHPFWHMDQVIISPHQAYLSQQNIDRIMALFKENIIRYQSGQPLLNQVDKLKGY
ncbi:D-2-hydroxyacid dehydrogenase [Amphibacillus cookii]|uniref:D-2-hydroxyacid dehydrogenase n=1 Tax=Amphibacillus cookii TaxID=767787 RepID=UPI00195E3C73|nr:D-2-hydroxyacid dehydrogenase [Amphibacillus cookii]MBM7541616.1 phosphoglycerate dehydrogenase-like enzyme [Amphibacillus cookii]